MYISGLIWSLNILRSFSNNLNAKLFFIDFLNISFKFDVINSDNPSAVFKMMLPVNPSESKISHSPVVILFGSTKPTKLFLKNCLILSHKPLEEIPNLYYFPYQYL